MVFSKTMGESTDGLVADALRPAACCSGGFTESTLASGDEVRNTDNAREFKVPALRAAKPVRKSRRVVANFILITPSHWPFVCAAALSP